MQEIDSVTVARALTILDCDKAVDAGDIAIPLASGEIQVEKHILGNAGQVAPLDVLVDREGVSGLSVFILSHRVLVTSSYTIT
jgi:hypothetical protein